METSPQDPSSSRDPEIRQPNPTPETPPSRATGRTFYDLLADVVWPVIQNPKISIPVGTIVVAVAAIVFMLRSEGVAYEAEWFGVRVGGAKAELQSSTLRQCLADARELKRPYAIEAITYWIQIEKDTLNGNPAQRQTHRIFYTLRSLQEIAAGKDLFVEEIHSHDPHAVFEHWYGTEDENFHDDKKSAFQVLFNMDKDDVRTVVTGANFVLPLPFANRKELDHHLPIFANQDFQGYPNKEDAICELNVVIESKSLPIRPEGNAAKSYFQSNLKDAKANLRYDENAGNGVRTISARWRNVKIGETVGIYYSWPPENAAPAGQISQR